MRVRYILLLGFTLLAVWLLLQPVWLSSKGGPEARFEPFEAPVLTSLSACALILVPDAKPGHLGTVGLGPAQLLFDSTGDAYTGLADASIMVQDKGAVDWRVITQTMGRPMGMAFGSDGRWLYIADAEKGLMRSDRQGHLERLVDTLEARDLGFVYDVVAAPDGMLYLSVPDPEYGPEDMAWNMLQHRGLGRILRYDPLKRRLEVFAERLYFPSDLELGEDGKSLLVVETLLSRVLRFELDVPASKAEVYIESIPGLPIAIDQQSDGSVALALWSGRSAAIDRLGAYPRIREMISGLPKQFRPWLPAAEHALLIWHPEGELCIVETAEDWEWPGQLTSIQNRDGRWLIGSLEAREIRSFRLERAEAERRGE